MVKRMGADCKTCHSPRPTHIWADGRLCDRCDALRKEHNARSPEPLFDEAAIPGARTGTWTGGGAKFDADKPRFELLDAETLEEVAKVMTFGAKKYAAHNWRKGLEVSRLLGAALRHTFSILRGEDKDPETGLHHASHAICCLMFVFWTLKHRPELDDRYKGETK